MHANDRGETDRILQTLNATLHACLRRLQSDPQSQPLIFIESQLRYLIGIASGRIFNRSRLNQMMIGAYALREFEARDMAFANLLYEVQMIVDLLRRG